jgi:hypothetical protein
LALPAMPVIAASASTVCLGTNIVFGVTEPASEATYTWAGTEGTASGIGDGTYTVSGSTTGTKSVTAYASLATNGTTCQSGNSYLSAVVSQPGSNGQASDATCGCAAGTTPCSGTCTTSGTYTKNDGACTGACNTAYVQQYDQCGHVLKANYDTYPKSACTSGCGPVRSSACTQLKTTYTDCTDDGTCATWCLSIAKQGQYDTYNYLYTTVTHYCYCYLCK